MPRTRFGSLSPMYSFAPTVGQLSPESKKQRDWVDAETSYFLPPFPDKSSHIGRVEGAAAKPSQGMFAKYIAAKGGGGGRGQVGRKNHPGWRAPPNGTSIPTSLSTHHPLIPQREERDRSTSRLCHDLIRAQHLLTHIIMSGPPPGVTHSRYSIPICPNMIVPPFAEMYFANIP